MLGRIKVAIEPLVNEILDQLPPQVWTSATTTFLDPAMGGGQFVREVERRLREAGHTDANISGRVYGCETSLLSVKYSLNKYKLAGTYSVGDFLTQDFGDMKFDVIVGNPPYKELASNGRQTNKSIWKDFLIKSMSLVNSNGYIGMVHPMGWAAPSDRGQLNQKYFTKLNLVWANVSTNLKANFKGVGSTFSVTLTKNEPYAGNSVIKHDDGETSIDFRVTKLVVPKGMGIIKKITDIPNKCNFKLAGKKEQYSGEGSAVSSPRAGYKNIHHVNSSKDYEPGTTIPVKYSTTPSKLTNLPKVVIPYNGPPNIIIDEGHYGVGWCQYMRLSLLEIEGAKSVFNSKLFKFFVNKKHTQYNETKNLNLFPKLDFTKIWTDAELYAHFGLTQKEIDYLEANVK